MALIVHHQHAVNFVRLHDRLNLGDFRCGAHHLGLCRRDVVHGQGKETVLRGFISVGSLFRYANIHIIYETRAHRQQEIAIKQRIYISTQNAAVFCEPLKGQHRRFLRNNNSFEGRFYK